MSRRLLANLRIDALEKLFDEKRDNVDMQTTLLAELSVRKPTSRVSALRRRVMQALSVAKKDAGKNHEPTQDDAVLLDLTPAQHRRLAEIYRRAGPDWTEEERAHGAKLAEHHEMVAKGIERRTGKAD